MTWAGIKQRRLHWDGCYIHDLEEAGQLMGIPLLDHLIIGRNGGYYSFADAGDISPQTAGYRGMVLREGKED